MEIGGGRNRSWSDPGSCLALSGAQLVPQPRPSVVSESPYSSGKTRNGGNRPRARTVSLTRQSHAFPSAGPPPLAAVTGGPDGPSPKRCTVGLCRPSMLNDVLSVRNKVRGKHENDLSDER